MLTESPAARTSRQVSDALSFTGSTTFLMAGVRQRNVVTGGPCHALLRVTSELLVLCFNPVLLLNPEKAERCPEAERRPEPYRGLAPRLLGP